jgi:hypothetical protein
VSSDRERVLVRLQAIVCDRCREPSEAPELSAHQGVVMYLDGKPVDLCDRCAAELRKWLGERPTP